MNKYLKNLNKIEFVVTNACTGKCKHCSQGDHADACDRIDADIASDAVKKIASLYDIKTVMTFGGEPLLHFDAVYKIMKAASECNISKRQVITNGYFTQNKDKIKEITQKLFDCGVNDLLLSVDAFHQETIPLDIVKTLAIEAINCGVPIRIQPAWLVSEDDNNPYNIKTRELINCFGDLNIETNDGNIIFPEGNAVKYFAEYFNGDIPENPYVDDPFDVRCVSFSANGDVLGENVYKKDIIQILEDYQPKIGE